MIRLTLRTLLAYLDDTLPPADAKVIGQKLAENQTARELADRIRTLTRKRSLSTPAAGPEGSSSDPNTVAAYLSDALSPELVERFEKVSLESDAQLAELAACHQILTLVLAEQVRVPPTAYRRMYGLVKGKEAMPNRQPGRHSIPVGGVVPSEKPHEADETDAAYLLGLPAYSRNEPAGRKALRWGVAAMLACGFVLAAFLAWPAAQPPNGDLVQATPTTKKEDLPPPSSQKEQPPPPTDKKEDPKKEDPKKEDPKREDPKDELGGKQPPNDVRGVVGVSGTANDQVLLARKAGGDGWAAVARGADVYGTDRLLALPGYKVKVQFKSGVTAELWGNIAPDLLPAPLFHAAITPFIPADGFDADLALHTGRVYLGTSSDKAVIRVRVGDAKFKAKDHQFDLTLADKGSEVVVEVRHRLTPGAADDPPQTLLVVYVLNGSVSVPVKRKPVTAAAGEALVFDSAKGELTGPTRQDERGGKESTYFSRSPVYPDPVRARAMLSALDKFADRVKDVNSVPAAVAELRADPTKKPDSEAEFFAGSRFSVFATAALGDVSELADVANNPNRPDLRVAAVEALRGLMATEPDQVDALRTVTRERWKLAPADADALLVSLSGLDDGRRADAEFTQKLNGQWDVAFALFGPAGWPGEARVWTPAEAALVNKLVEQLRAKEVAQREAAQYALVTQVDVPPRGRSPAFDVNGPAEEREAGVRAWERRVKEILK